MNGLTSTLPHPPWRWRENILQLLPDAVVPSKDELAAYWHTVAQKALRYLARRPLKLVRHTRGTTFYHKEPPAAGPDSVHQLRIEKREGGDGVRVWIHCAEGFNRLVEMGVVEAHPGPRPSTTSSLPIGWGFVNRNPVERN